MKKDGIKNKFKLYITITGFLTVILNILGCFKGFCGIYKDYIYVYIASILGCITSPIPILIGEIFMYIGVILLVIWFIVLLLLVLFRKKVLYVKFVKIYSKSIFAIICTVVLLYTTNWIIPFRAPHLDVKPEIDKKYTVDELQLLRNYTVNKLNQVAETIERDEDNRIVLAVETIDNKINNNSDKATVNNNSVDNKFNKSISKTDNISDYVINNLPVEIAKSMNDISKEYPLLRGYYPRPKPSYCSFALDWMGIAGYTYPYTMEVSYNKYIDYLYAPVLYSHEQCHHKGYYQENEATFLSIMACIHSDSKYLQYSGYLELYRYIESDYVMSMLNVYDDNLAYEMIANQPQIIDLVREDYTDSYNKSRDLYSSEVSPTLENLFKEKTKEVGDAGWKVQGEIIGEATYSGCVKYLLEYYDGILY